MDVNAWAVRRWVGGVPVQSTGTDATDAEAAAMAAMGFGSFGGGKKR